MSRVVLPDPEGPISADHFAPLHRQGDSVPGPESLLHFRIDKSSPASGDRDRDQRLTQILALVPAQEDLLHRDAHRGDDDRRDDRGDDPVRQVDL